MKRIFITAGEASGDIHGAKLMREIKAGNSEVEFYGFGGVNMIKEGLNTLVDIQKISVVGFWEVAKKYFYFRKLLTECQNSLTENKIDLYIPIDYPGFNLRLCSYAKKKGISVIYYIAPQLWAWGKNRAGQLKKNIDKLLVVFPFEVEYFSKFGIETEFVGHPLLDNDLIKKEFPKSTERENRIAILPGSRKQELKRHIELIEKICEILYNMNKELKFGIAVSPLIKSENYKVMKGKIKNLELWESSIELMMKSKVGIIKTGTSNLEAALCGMPFIMFYKTSAITYNLGKKLINLPYISIVNILANKLIINEFIQKEATPENISKNIMKIIENEEKYLLIQKEFKNIMESLGSIGASKKAAEIIKKFLKI